MEKMIKILGAILTGDVNTTLRLSNELMDQGKEPQSYISELLKLLETIYLKENGLLDIYSKEEQKLLKKYMDLDGGTYTRIYNVFYYKNSILFSITCVVVSLDKNENIDLSQNEELKLLNELKSFYK